MWVRTFTSFRVIWKQQSDWYQKKMAYGTNGVFFGPFYLETFLLGHGSTKGRKIHGRERYHVTILQENWNTQYNMTVQDINCLENQIYNWNTNKDIIVSNLRHKAIIVTYYGGCHRSSYSGPQSGPRLSPRSVCTDVLSHILVSVLKPIRYIC